MYKYIARLSYFKYAEWQTLTALSTALKQIQKQNNALQYKPFTNLQYHKNMYLVFSCSTKRMVLTFFILGMLSRYLCNLYKNMHKNSTIFKFWCRDLQFFFNRNENLN